MNTHKVNFKKIVGALLLMALSPLAYAQTPAVTESINTDFSGLEFGLIILVAITLIIVLLVLVASVSIYNHSVELLREKQGLPIKAENGFAEWFWKTFNAAKPERSVIMGHEYDGIRELDNDLPPWWKYGFYLTIIMGLVYVYVYANGIAPDSTEEYQAEVSEGIALKAAYLAKMAASINEENVTLADVAGITKGKELFAKKCKTCHGDVGQGVSAPNLTDQYWIHGGGIKNIYKTIKYGVPAKGMISWQDQLTPLEIQQVASFVLSLQGTNPADGKEPQGDLYQEKAE